MGLNNIYVLILNINVILLYFSRFILTVKQAIHYQIAAVSQRIPSEMQVILSEIPLDPGTLHLVFLIFHYTYLKYVKTLIIQIFLVPQLMKAQTT